MAGAPNRRVSAAAARAHTRKAKQSSSFKLSFGIFSTTFLVLLIGVAAWAYQAIQPPPPKKCGSPDGPAVTASRIKLTDGRHLAYSEYGLPKDTAKYKIVFVHGVDSCRHDAVVAHSLSPEIIKGLRVYIVSFDRPGYGESDPHPTRTMKSMALDIEELADQLELGPKFYVIGFSMGGNALWGCLKYIPHRLAGAALLAPVVNYWWPSFPSNLSTEAYYQQLPQDQWTLRVAHYAPWLTYWWNSQKWFPASSVLSHRRDILSRQDTELLPKLISKRQDFVAQVRQQGEYESVHRDLIVGFGAWEFDPMDLGNPFPNSEGSVHLWQGDEDRLVPVTLQRYIAQRLPWIHYHELPGAGHMFPVKDGLCDTVVKTLLIGDM
ncbi:hypothetical protein ACOSP7_028956 [Xanthoceras sorbifolium]|uniref:AB hydrolase-1 domain-containing protein n=1 Tax=Xanthoceras sorbifolium TaxID=99658 RepID=A0ABQ8HC57_9ROSI|nr:hypothetical protein JRO89_XS12G0104800 [Xanthoceras sorbifolium]